MKDNQNKISLGKRALLALIALLLAIFVFVVMNHWLKYANLAGLR